MATEYPLANCIDRAVLSDNACENRIFVTSNCFIERRCRALYPPIDFRKSLLKTQMFPRDLLNTSTWMVSKDNSKSMFFCENRLWIIHANHCFNENMVSKSMKTHEFRGSNRSDLHWHVEFLDPMERPGLWTLDDFEKYWQHLGLQALDPVRAVSSGWQSILAKAVRNKIRATNRQ